MFRSASVSKNENQGWNMTGCVEVEWNCDPRMAPDHALTHGLYGSYRHNMHLLEISQS